MGDKVKKIKKENPDRQAIKRHIWKSSEDKILLNILKDQTLNGGKEGTSYTKKAWREIQEQFNDSKVDKLELQQIKNRHKYYRSCYATMDRVLKLTGFGWDDEDKMIKASDETWEDLISKDKNLQEYRDKVWPSWIDLEEICASSTASGDAAISSKGNGETSKVEIDLNEVVDLESNEADDSPVGCPKKSDTTKPDKNKKCNASVSQDTSKGRKRTADDAITALDRLADASLSIVESKKNAAQQTEAYSVKSCMQILNGMPHLEAKKKLKAAQAFTDCNQRAVFIEMDEETRSLWIQDV
ncbi:hypothetical protein QYE76_048658 [Lolium multiflorum]|uniref:Myb/SANT-like domain-containing protein n=1 Tax=Lolium multiflorum TaxID=4521 RepID=A0AAD8SMT3_LOLMU|nr:hypothetical protein QYE76_048658 [Lolium multiflorum]